MKKSQWFIVATLLIVALALAALVESKRGSQYRLGMTIAEVRALTAGRYPTQKFGMEYDGHPTPQQMNEDPLFYMHDEASGVLLMFNHHEKLIEKKRTKWFGINVIKALDSIRPRN
jgi:hypothetical protein